MSSTKQQGFAVLDVKSKLFNQPYFVATNGVAIRGFANACEKENELQKYPEDFQLYHIGEYDMETGLLHPLDQPKLIATASEFVIKE
jgi:hypothetical protein